MKKWFLVFAFLLAILIVPIAEATIRIEGPSKEIYNLGDKIDISGYIIQDKDMWALFKLDLDCEESLQLLVRTVSLKMDEKHEFKETLPVPTFLTGVCTVKASIESDGKIVEQEDSREFVITKALDGKIEVEETRIQLGKPIVISGAVYKKDGTNTEGTATIYFKQNDINYWVDTVEIKNGEFKYEHDSTKNPSGIYDIEVFVNDIYGNQQLFVNVSSFTLVSEIYIIAKPAMLHVLPGSKAGFHGEAKTILQEPIGEATVYLFFNNTKYETQLKNSKFSYEIKIPKNIKTGKHILYVSVEDLLGNKGNTSTDFYVDAVASQLKNELSVEGLKPEEPISINSLLFDQASDLIIEDISIELINPKGKKILSQVTKTNIEVEFILPKFSLPGTWIVKSYAAGLTQEDKIYVEGVPDVEFTLVNQTLYVRNVGNIKYKKPIEIKLKGMSGESTIIKKTSLAVNQSFAIHLNEEVVSGKYDILVGNKVFKNVVIVGAPKRDYTKFYYILAVLVVLLLIYFFFSRTGKRKRIRWMREKAKKEGKELGEKLKKIKARKEEMLSPKEKKQKQLREFREQILRDVEKRGTKPFKFKPKKTSEEIIIEPKETKEPSKSMKVDKAGFLEIKSKEESSIVFPKEKEEEIVRLPEERRKAIIREEIKKPEKKFEAPEEKSEKKKGLFSMFD